jgi:hypothetical protein
MHLQNVIMLASPTSPPPCCTTPISLPICGGLSVLPKPLYTTDRGSESGTGNAELFSRASPSIVGPFLYIIQFRHAKAPSTITPSNELCYDSDKWGLYRSYRLRCRTGPETRSYDFHRTQITSFTPGLALNCSKTSYCVTLTTYIRHVSHNQATCPSGFKAISNNDSVSYGPASIKHSRNWCYLW